MKLIVESTDDGDLVATLHGYRAPVLDADRTADHFFEPVLAALTAPAPAEPGDPEPADEPPPSPPTPSPPTSPAPADPEQTRRTALNRLDAGDDPTDICTELGISAAQLRRWDDDVPPGGMT